MDLLDFQKKWIKLVDKFSQQGVDRLTTPEKVWLNVQTFLGSVQNGGIVALYCNPWPYMNHMEDMLKSLDILGVEPATQIKRIVQKCNTCFKNSIVPKDISKRNNILNHWGKKKWQLLDECDNEFFVIDNDLEKELVTYLQTHDF